MMKRKKKIKKKPGWLLYCEWRYALPELSNETGIKIRKPD